MSRNFSDYTDIFFWNYQRMDNVNYNFEIVDQLCQIRNKNNDECLKLNKPIIVLLMAIIECILYDFLRRVNEHRNEIIPGLDQDYIDDARQKIIDDLEPLITHVKKYNLLRVSDGENIYQDLDYLRKLRNRIHIQNRQQQLDQDECKIWSNHYVKLTAQALEKICEVLCEVYPRPRRELILMDDFPRPWLRVC